MKEKLLALAICAIAATPLFAHHGRGFKYSDNEVSVKGTVSQVAWRNPHVRVFVDVKDQAGKVVTWEFEGAGTTNLAQQGYSRTTLKIGQEITAVVHPARNGTPEGHIVRFLNTEGKEIWRAGNNPLD